MGDHIQIGDISPRVHYLADGETAAFTYPFPIFADADMEAFVGDVLQTTGYTVNGAGASAGGSVVFDPVPAAGARVTLRRRLAIQRTSDFQEAGEFRAKVLNDELDYQTAAIQQVADDVGRAMRLAGFDGDATLTLPVKAERAGKVLGFGADGEPVVTDVALSDLDGITVAAAASAAAADAARIAAQAAEGGATSARNAAEAAQAAAEAAASRLAGTSASAVAVGTGAKSFTTQAGKAFGAGAWLLVTSDADPAGTWMHGSVTSYAGIALAMDIASAGGTGTRSDWTIRVAGTRGGTGAAGPEGPQGPQGEPGAGDLVAANNLSDLADVATARANLGLGAAAVEAVAAGGSAALLRADGDGSALTGIAAADAALRANVLLNAFRIAVVGGLSIQNMVDGVVDEFEDETGIDTGASSGQTYDSAGDYYHNPSGGYTGDQVPDMTSNTAPSGTASASLESALAWQAFDDDNATYWQAASTTAGWIAYEFTAAKTIGQYTLDCRPGAETQMAGAWTFEGWNGSGWDVLDTVAGQTGWVNGTVRTFTCDSVGSYAKYRLNVTATDGGDSISIAEIEMKAVEPSADVTLISAASTAAAAPADVFVVLWQEDVDAVALDTDLKAWASRDDGATWTQVALAEQAVLSTGRVLSGSADVSAQPSGTAMRWKVTTHNSKQQRLHGVALQWS